MMAAEVLAAPFPLDYVSPEVDAVVLRAEALLMEREYEAADRLLAGLEARPGQRLLGSLGRAMVRLVAFLEAEGDRSVEEAALRRALERNRAAAAEVERRRHKGAWELFLLGGSLGARGLYELEKGRYVAAVIHGLGALGRLDQAERLDPGIRDIGFARGLYIYYRSVKTRYLWFLPLVRDRRAEGIALIARTLEQGHYAVPACKIALTVLAEEQGETAGGIARGRVYLAEYPRCLLLRRPLARLYERAGRWAEAAETWRDGYTPAAPWTRGWLLDAARDFLRAGRPAEAAAVLARLERAGPTAAQARAAREIMGRAREAEPGARP